jgi:hypothetical protein
MIAGETCWRATEIITRPRHHAQAEGAIEDFKKFVAGRGPPVVTETELIS